MQVAELHAATSTSSSSAGRNEPGRLVRPDTTTTDPEAIDARARGRSLQSEGGCALDVIQDGEVNVLVSGTTRDYNLCCPCTPV